MKKLILGLACVALATPALAKPVSVRGHVRSDGTYVQPHVRSSPNNTRYDNWSSKPNTNPYLGANAAKAARAAALVSTPRAP
jgi:hypothetical protein